MRNSRKKSRGARPSPPVRSFKPDPSACSRCGRGTAAHTPIDAHGRAADGPRRRLKASPAVPRTPRVASPTHTDPLVGSLLVSREGGRCVSPLRGRWHKGDFLHGTGGRRLGGGRVATELDCVGFGCIVETLFDDDWIGACTL